MFVSVLDIHNLQKDPLTSSLFRFCLVPHDGTAHFQAVMKIWMVMQGDARGFFVSLPHVCT